MSEAGWDFASSGPGMPGKDQRSVGWHHGRWPKGLPLSKAWLGRTPYLLAIAVLLFMVWATTVLVSYPVDGFSFQYYTGLIHAIDPQGPAGLLLSEGDLLIAVDGVPYYSNLANLADKRPGELIKLTLEHRGELKTVQFSLAKPGFDELVRRLSPILVSLLIWMVGVGVLAMKPDEKSAVAFFILSQIACALLVSGALTNITNLWIVTLFRILLFLIGPLSLHFHIEFIQPEINSPIDRVLVPGYLLAALGGVVMVASSPERIQSFSWYRHLLPLSRLFLSIFIFAVVALLAHAYLMSSRVETRARVRLVGLGWIMGVLPVTSASILPDTLIGQPLLPYPIGFLLIGIVPLTYGYAFLGHDSSRGRESVSWAATQFLVYALVGGLFSIVIGLIYRFVPGGWFADPLFVSMLVLGLVIIFPSLRSWFQVFLEMAFYGSSYNYRKLVAASSQALNRSLDHASLGEYILVVARRMRFRAGALFLPAGELFSLFGQYGDLELPDAKISLPQTGALACLLVNNRGVLWREQIVVYLGDQVLSASERALVRNKAARLWVPLVSRGQLRGLLILGPQYPDGWVPNEDLDILVTLGAMAAVAAENVGLATMLRAQLKVIEDARLELAEGQRRLLEGREAERVQLARELHDGPVQGLHAIRLRLGSLDKNGDSPYYPEIQSELLEVIHELREISMNLRPPVLAHFGIQKAVQSIIDQFSREHPDVSFRLDLVPGEDKMSSPIHLAIYRICQEALNNAVQHAHADRITVRMAYNSRWLFLEVSDDGCGFVVPERWIQIARQGHLGLLGMAERAEAIGGRLIVRSRPGNGTRLRVLADLRAAELSMDDEQSE